MAVYRNTAGLGAGESRAIRSTELVLQNVHIGIGIAAVPVRERAELEFPRQRENAPGHNAIGDVRRQNSVNVRPNHWLRERNEHTRKIVQVAARAAPDVGSVEFVSFMDREVDRSFQFAVMGAS